MNNTTENTFTDQALVNKVLRGHTNAFKAIVKHTEGLVTQIIFKMVANNEDRRDLAQDVYLKVYQKLSGFKFKSKLSTWVGQITYNTCLNYLEKKKLVLIDEHDSGANKQFETSKNNTHLFSNETEKLVFTKELSQILKKEIDNLSPLYKTLITLYHNEDLSYSEIAQITELPEGTVKNYLFRARKVLRERLQLTYKTQAS
ncbi:sigma-70 family RNA polymerase sigma factor [Danxiaibacter flavus]|uniref:Sigma-70 family RNA polymerase sigma factor n=1 Tax=Danxiaibacter flavus TaxID=3049108 RepID=A0ABV3ZKU3_9BACT|nr:sigma-70 family RNA polymerase sigma factor [Chitinophagaceae bacterium DXS]